MRAAVIGVQVVATISAIVAFGDEGLSNNTALLLLIAAIATYWHLRLATRRR